MSEIDKLLTQIDGAVPQVAEQNGAFHSAIDAESAAEVRLLDATLDKLRPALQALASRVECDYRCWWVGSVRTETKSHYFAWRGLYLSICDDRPGPGKENPSSDQNRGSYEGEDYFLVCRDTDTPDNVGRFARVEYSGSWSIWQGEENCWSANAEIIDAAQAIAGAGLENILESISEALAAQLKGKKPDRAKQATDRAAQLQALVTLLGAK